ncbi:MAG TPA: DUF2244 domain-containing protein [Acetobacteraceae bacterium]|jgi:uncharacterized membrane protein|nr:DUF2244 domain-containing protein [Acetobacteraceae bacterium]
MTLGGSTAEPVLFEAVILPHRSLSVRGRAWLIGLICLLGTLTGVRFWLIGAWPVVAFSAAEIGIAVLLLWLNARQARSSELLLLDPTALRIVRTTPAGQREERVLAVGWLNAVLEERPGRVPGLLLVARGVREEIGAALGEAERRNLAQALSTALHLARNPRFNNAQLQDGELPDQ